MTPPVPFRMENWNVLLVKISARIGKGEISLSLSGEKERRRKRRIKCRERDRREEFFFELFQMILEIIIQKSGERLLTELSGRIIELPLLGGMQFKTSIINGHVLDGAFRERFRWK